MDQQLSTDNEQNRRITTLETDVGHLKSAVTELDKSSALVAQSVDALGETFSTGMIKLDADAQARVAADREERRAERKATAEQLGADRDHRRWFWGRIFAILASLATVGGTAGGALYLQGDSPPPPPATTPP